MSTGDWILLGICMAILATIGASFFWSRERPETYATSETRTAKQLRPPVR